LNNFETLNVRNGVINPVPLRENLRRSGSAGSQAPAWEPRKRSSSFARQEARASGFEFPSWSLGTSGLDQYEECGPGFLQPTEYVRELCELRLQNDQIIQAWFYRYNRGTDALKLLASGDFLADLAGNSSLLD
jgi:hypothetical protein